MTTIQDKAVDYMAVYALMTSSAASIPQSIQARLRTVSERLRQDLMNAGEFNTRVAADHLLDKYELRP